jgi:hypothetical protein
MPKKRTRSSRAAATRKVDERQRILLDQLKELASGIGADVREERLVREVGYSVRSGPCLLNGQKIVLLDTNAELTDRIEAMLDYLAGCDLDQLYMEPELRELIATRVLREPHGAEG